MVDGENMRKRSEYFFSNAQFNLILQDFARLDIKISDSSIVSIWQKRGRMAFRLVI